MRIGIDIRPLQTTHRYQGVGSYVSGLLYGLAQLNLPWKYVLIFDRSLPIENTLPVSLPYEFVGIWRPDWHTRTKEAWNQILTPYEVIKHKLSIVHFTAPEFVSLWTPIPSVVTIHDLILFGKFSPLKTGFKYRFLYKAASKADIVLAVSQSTQKDFIHHFGSKKEHVKVIHLGVDERFLKQISGEEKERIKIKYGLDKPYILYVGDLTSELHNARKNLPIAMEIFNEACKRTNKYWMFVLAGKRGSYSNWLQKKAEHLGIKDQLVFTDYVTEEDLPILIASAEIFIYLSNYEGFGLPVLEAMAVGTPVLTSNRSSIPELCANASLMVNPEDRIEGTNALVQLMTQPELRQILAERGRARAVRFTWTETARKTALQYEAVLSK